MESSTNIAQTIFQYAPFVFAGLFLLVLLGALLFALIRGLSKSRVRFIILAVCLILAFVITGVFKTSAKTVYQQLETTIEQSLSGDEAAEFFEVISGSEPLQETIVGLATALVAPLIFFVSFVALRIVTWIVYFLVMLFVGGKMRKKDKTKKLRLLRALAWGFLQAVLIFFVLMTPLYAYLSIAFPALQVALEQEEVQNAINNSGISEQYALNPQEVIYTTSSFSELGEGDGVNRVIITSPSSSGYVITSSNHAAAVAYTITAKSDGITQYIQSAITQTQNNFFFATYGTLGGKATCNFLTSFTSGGEKTTVTKEMESIGALVTEGMKLKDISGVEDLNEETAKVISNLMSSIGDSKMVKTLVGEVIYAVTDAWQNNQSIFGIEKPEMDAMIAPLFDVIVNDFHSDARVPEQLSSDFQTLGEMVSVLARAEFFKNISESNSDQLIESLANGTVIKDLITALGKNGTLKNLISELANLGMRAIGTSVLNLPENAEEIYSQYITEITNAVNSVLTADLTDEEKVDLLAQKMTEAIDNSGLDVDLDESVVKLYADAILSDIREAGLTYITEDDVRDFFRIFAAMNEEQSASQNTAPLAVTVKANTKYKGTLYGNKNQGELNNSAVAKLVGITRDIAKASEEATDEETFREQLQQITEKFNITVNLSNLPKNSFTQESLKTVSAIKEGSFPTVRITMEDLLIDTKKVNDQINEETIEAEAEKIGSIFNTAMKVKDAFADSSEGFNIEQLNDIAADLGGILDSLESTDTFEGKTSLMITAIFQKEEVAKSMDMDIRTATKLAKAATESVDGAAVDYAATMESVSTGASIAAKLGETDGKITEDDIETLLKSMTPQTANMLKVYLTENRVKSYGIEENAATASVRLLVALFDEMAKDYPDYSAEKSAMLKMFDVAKVATQGSSKSESIFTHGEVEGLLKMTAEETVELVMSSNMVRNAVVAAMYQNGAIDPNMVNPFGLNIPTGEPDYQECEAAIEAYHNAHPDDKAFLKAVAAFFGVEASFLD